MKLARMSIAIVIALVLFKILQSAVDVTEPRQLSTGSIYVLYDTQGERVSTVSEFSSDSGKLYTLSGRQRYLYLKYKSGLLFPGDFCEEARELWSDLRPRAEGLGVDVVVIERSGSKYWRRNMETRFEFTDEGFRSYSARLEFARVAEAEWGKASFGAACLFRLQ